MCGATSANKCSKHSGLICRNLINMDTQLKCYLIYSSLIHLHFLQSPSLPLGLSHEVMYELTIIVLLIKFDTHLKRYSRSWTLSSSKRV